MIINKNKKNKRSQITVFIIVGIVLVIIASLSYYLITKQSSLGIYESVAGKTDVNSVRSFVEGCIIKSSESGLQLLGVQGGKINLPNEFLMSHISNISYSYYKGENTVASLSELENELNSFVTSAVPICVDDFKSLKQEGMDVEGESIVAKSSINPNDVLVNLNYELIINGKLSSEKFQIILPVELYKIQGYANEIVDKVVDDPDWLDITYLSSFDVPISIIPHSDDSFIISIVDPESKIAGDNFIYLLGLKFKNNYAPSLNIASEFRLARGSRFNHKVEALDPEGDSFVFTDNHAMFDITEDGVIDFVPTVAGDFYVTITATDVHDNSNSKEVKFIVR